MTGVIGGAEGAPPAATRLATGPHRRRRPGSRQGTRQLLVDAADREDVDLLVGGDAGDLQAVTDHGAGVANGDAIQAVMGKLLTDVLNNQPSDPLTFVPLADGRNLTVKILDVKVDAHKMTMTVQPMSQAQRTAALKRIQSGWTVAAQ